jgi:hypothetical protein
VSENTMTDPTKQPQVGERFTPLSTFPIADADLQGVVALASSVLDLQVVCVDCFENRDRFKTLLDRLERVVSALEGHFWDQQAAQDLQSAARPQPTGFQAPGWFWQAENQDAGKMLARRAKYLRAAKVAGADAQDLLRTFAVDTLRIENPDAILSQTLTAAFGGGKGGPNADAR